jgi:hypothetical protein
MNPIKALEKLRRLVNSVFQSKEQLSRLAVDLDEVKINQGKILSVLNEQRNSKSLHDYEFSVFSQWGEDGIIQHLTRIVDIGNKTFIEFGVEDFSESNCRFLLVNDNWRGFVIDGSGKNIQELKNSYYYWKYDLVAIEAFITRDNINQLLAESGFEQDLGILSVDIDGNDYYVLDAIANFHPRILICEFNAVFGGTRCISVPYDKDFDRTAKHHSNLYTGASLAAITHLAQNRGYTLVGTNSARNNAFYVRSDLMNDKLQALTVEQAYSPSNFRESRDEHGCLTFVAGDDRLELIRGMPVFNVQTQKVEQL